MKTKILILAALMGAAAMSANAGVRFGISIGLPLPVVVSSPVVYAPAPVAVVQTVPSCPGVDYVWAPGYWSYRPDGRVWVSGAWQYRPAHVTYVNDRHAGRNHDGHLR
ncbi:MAG: YXWGXW repeat-containing protein [Verrucomicrobiia bacterium]